MFSRITQSAQQNVGKEEINSIILPLPTIYEQKKISYILSSIDESIWILQKQNKIIEKMIQTIFKSWFIDFDGQTEFEDSELGKIPKGWPIVKFGDYVELKHGHQFRNYDFTKTGLAVLKISQIQHDHTINMSNCSYVAESRLSEFSDFLINTGDILMALTGTTLGKIARGIDDTIILQNYRVGKFIPINQKEIPNDFLYYLIQSKSFLTQLFSRTTISAQENIGKEEINNIKVYLPPFSDRQKFSKITGLITKIIQSNHKKLKLLKSIHDSLLPKLMSGEIRV